MPTRRDDIADIVEIAGIPRVALREDALDVLELVLTGALASLPTLPGISPGDDVVLTDGENTPVAHLAWAGATPILRAVRPFARGDGPHWDPTTRRSAATVRSDLRRVAGDRRVLGIIVDDVPTRADMRALVEAVKRVEPAAMLCAVPVGRARPPVGRVDAVGMTRIGRAVADALAADGAGLPIESAVIPFPGPTAARAAGIEVASVLEAYGATESVGIGSLRSPTEAARVAALPRLLEREVADLYPDAFVSEVLDRMPRVAGAARWSCSPACPDRASRPSRARSQRTSGQVRLAP